MSKDETRVCSQCSQALDVADAYCRKCGLCLVKKSAPIMNSRLSILLLLFLGVGPLALPTLWKSQAFNNTQKAWLSILNIAFMLVLVWVLFWIYNSVVFRLSGLEFEPGF